MKIIALQRRDLSIPASPATPACLVPDSALVLQGRPVFVPDLGSGWVGQPVVALRVGRLGRDIAPAFAARYVDAATVALWLRLPQVPAELSAGMLDAMDSSLAPGRWVDIAALPTGPVEITTANASVTVDLAAEIKSTVTAVSRYMTLKMGDIILAAMAGPPLDLVPGTRVTASMAGDEVLSVKIV